MRAAVAAALAALCVAAASAQRDWQRWGRYRGGEFGNTPPRFPGPHSFDGSFNFCRILYESDRREDRGMGWGTDYPRADVNFTIRLSELTKTPVSLDANGQPNFLVVRFSDDALFHCPFVIMEDAGTAYLDEDEIKGLRAYLLKGGFLLLADYWGTEAFKHAAEVIGQALPPGEYPIVSIPMDHPMFHTLFQVAEVPQVPSIQFWRWSGGDTSERGPDSPRSDVHAIKDRSGRIMVLMFHNTDIPDAWEREGDDPTFFYRFSVDGYAVGIDMMLYAMSH